MDKERYRKGAHTVTDLKYHFVWNTKHRSQVLRNDVALRLRDIIREICAEKELEVVKGSIRPDHVHILIGAPAHYSPAKIAQYLKGKSSYRLQRELPDIRKQYWGRPLWGRGYFCSTVGAVPEEQIKQYIANQSDETGRIEGADELPGADDAEPDFDPDLRG
jgi:putative transposase